MRRKIGEKLRQWRHLADGRMPMVLYGARQTGKTFAMRELGDEEFHRTVYVNFEEDAGIRQCFHRDISPAEVIRLLENYYCMQIIPDRTLIIFDEIQMCPEALAALQYFFDELPEYYIIAAGNFLCGEESSSLELSFGEKIQKAAVYPMDFEEFLWAEGKEWLAAKIRHHFILNTAMPGVMHSEAMQEYHHYCMTGGMPAVVRADICKDNSLSPAEIRQMIFNTYISDMLKYEDTGDAVKIYETYDSLLAQLTKDTKKFQYKRIKDGARASQYREAIDWLVRAGIAHKCCKCTQGEIPLDHFSDTSSFKMYYNDLGILSARAGMSQRSFLSPENDRFQEIYAENYVACALRACGCPLYYWESEGTAQMDFLIVREGRVIPVECKTGDCVKAKSLRIYRDKYMPSYSIRVSGRNFGMVDKIKYVPLYAVFCI